MDESTWYLVAPDGERQAVRVWNSGYDADVRGDRWCAILASDNPDHEEYVGFGRDARNAVRAVARLRNRVESRVVGPDDPPFPFAGDWRKADLGWLDVEQHQSAGGHGLWYVWRPGSPPSYGALRVRGFDDGFEGTWPDATTMRSELVRVALITHLAHYHEAYVCPCDANGRVVPWHRSR